VSRMNAAPLILGLALLAGCRAGPSDIDDSDVFTGTLRSGAELGEVKAHCANGLYLVADEGTYLADQTTMLLLRTLGSDEPMYADSALLGRRIRVTAARGPDRPACDALVCGCEDFLLVGDVVALDP